MNDVSLRATVEAALERGSSTTISFDHVPYTLGQMWEEANALAGSLAEVIQPGDRIVSMVRNSRAAVLGWWAAHLTSAIVVPLNVANRSSILEHQVRDSDPSVVIVASEFIEYLSASIAATGQRVRRVIVVDGPAQAWPGTEEACTLDDALTAGNAAFVPSRERGMLPSHLIYTAGTTGPSKACMVGDRFIDNMSRQMSHTLGKRSDETLWTAMPLFHLAAVSHLVGSIETGGSVSFAERFSASRFWEDIHRSGAKSAALMGSMLPVLAAAPDNEFTARCHAQLRVVSGSPVTERLANTWRERFGVERVGSGAYGMTEAALITYSTAETYRPGTAGQCNDSFEVAIVDENDEPVAVGETGEIVCRPRRPGVMFDGYWRDPAKTVEVFRNLWFHTGDFGRMDEDGYLWFVDRGKDYLRRGGENISSYEMEQVFVRHPAIREVAVHAVPSELSEDEVKVTAVLRDGAALTPEELFDWCEDLVPRYAHPAFIEFRDDLPKNPVGRVLKFKLREEGVTPSTWRRPVRSTVASLAPEVTDA